MNTIYDLFPKDLALIVAEYAVDRTQYNIVVKHLNKMIRKTVHRSRLCSDHLHFTSELLSYIKIIKYSIKRMKNHPCSK